jgi:hypothetical protein
MGYICPGYARPGSKRPDPGFKKLVEFIEIRQNLIDC